MKLTEFYLAEFDREAARSRRALEQVPEGKHDWKPHEKSMIFGYLAGMVASIPSWIAAIVTKDSMDIAPKEGPQQVMPKLDTSADYLQALDRDVAAARAALKATTDDHLNSAWQLLVAGNVVLNSSRHEMIGDTINHWIHHRGQMTVYLRLMGAKVPALYGPSADDKRFD